MKFVELEEDEFRTFLDSHPQKTFLQTPEVAHLREKSGWTIHYVAVKKDEKIVAASLLLSKKGRIGKYRFYAPRGLLVDYHDHEVLDYFVCEIKKYAKQKGAYSLRIDPYVVAISRDGDGNVIEGKEDNRSVIEHLKQLGFHENKKPEQVKWMYALDLENKTSDDILKNMKANTRNIIKKVLKSGITIEELSREQLDQFYDILLKTGERRQFAIRDFSYYQNMYDLLKPRGEIKYLVAKLNVKNYIQTLEEELHKEEEKKQKLSLSKNNGKKIGAVDETIGGIQKRLTMAQDILKKGEEEIFLSGSMFILIQPELIYLSSGNYEEYMYFNAQYLIQWWIIQYAIEHHFKRYNFYGISGIFDKNHPSYGIYDFKRGFHGYVEELIGEFEMPLHPIYYVYRILHKG